MSEKFDRFTNKENSYWVYEHVELFLISILSVENVYSLFTLETVRQIVFSTETMYAR